MSLILKNRPLILAAALMSLACVAAAEEPSPKAQAEAIRLLPFLADRPASWGVNPRVTINSWKPIGNVANRKDGSWVVWEVVATLDYPTNRRDQQAFQLAMQGDKVSFPSNIQLQATLEELEGRSNTSRRPAIKQPENARAFIEYVSEWVNDLNGISSAGDQKEKLREFLVSRNKKYAATKWLFQSKVTDLKNIADSYIVVSQLSEVPQIIDKLNAVGKLKFKNIPKTDISFTVPKSVFVKLSVDDSITILCSVKFGIPESLANVQQCPVVLDATIAGISMVRPLIVSATSRTRNETVEFRDKP